MPKHFRKSELRNFSDYTLHACQSSSRKQIPKNDDLLLSVLGSG